MVSKRRSNAPAPLQAAAAEPTRLEFLAPVDLRGYEVVPQGSGGNGQGDVPQGSGAGDVPPLKKPSFHIIAYTGGSMSVGGFHSPVVVAFEGVTMGNSEIPILLDHDSTQIIGQGTVKVDSAAIRVDGQMMGDTEEMKRVMTLAKDGFKWRASIGANVQRREFLEAGRKATVNGREMMGPMIIAREVLLQEVSFVAIPADQQTSAAVAATSPTGKGNHVNAEFHSWLIANGYSPDTLTAQQIKPLEAQWKTEAAATVKPQLDKVLGDAKSQVEYRQQIADITAQFLADMPGADAATIGKIETLAEAAIVAHWSAEKYENELLKASRPATKIFRPHVINGDDRLTDRIIEAALCVTGRLQDYEKQFDEQTLEIAARRFKNGIGLRQLMLICAQSHGYRNDFSGEVTLDVQRAAFGMLGPNRIQAEAGFSTNNIANILSNVANKFMRVGWNSVDLTCLDIAKVRPVKDFKLQTIVSLTGDLTFQPLGPTGEIKHGTLGEVVYNNQASTYARMLAITRQDIINDDTGALYDTPFKLGRGAALKLNDIFWTAFLGAQAAGFFSAGNNNILAAGTGDSTMDLTGLTRAEALFLNQTDPNGYPLGVEPMILVVPIQLKAAALALMVSERLVTGNTTLQPTSNIFKDRFRVAATPYLANTIYTGYSAIQWYMLADPATLPMIEIAALNGRVEPFVQQTDADFNVLGLQMRGFSDIGVARQEYRAAVMAAGTAS
jgi:hypothetical protein